MKGESITIVTAFFDIGRSNWNKDNGFVMDFTRTPDTYLNYFKELAKLDNQMVIFTTLELRDKIEKIRAGKPTIIITFDFYQKFKFLIAKIKQIQLDKSYQQQIPTSELNKPEYLSLEYVLLTNLKPYFVNQAIKMNLVKNEMVAWIDFGYCRDDKTLNKLKEWRYPFEQNSIHCFTINNSLQNSSKNDALEKMLKGEVLIIGGALVGTKNRWHDFYNLVFKLYKKGLQEQFIDDDQYFITKCYFEDSKIIKLNYLSNGKWFDLFKRYGSCNLSYYWHKLKANLKLN